MRGKPIPGRAHAGRVKIHPTEEAFEVFNIARGSGIRAVSLLIEAIEAFEGFLETEEYVDVLTRLE